MRSFSAPVHPYSILRIPGPLIKLAAAGGCTLRCPPVRFTFKVCTKNMLQYLGSVWFICNEINFTESSPRCYIPIHCHTMTPCMYRARTDIDTYSRFGVFGFGFQPMQEECHWFLGSQQARCKFHPRCSVCFCGFLADAWMIFLRHPVSFRHPLSLVTNSNV